VWLIVCRLLRGIGVEPAQAAAQYLKLEALLKWIVLGTMFTINNLFSLMVCG